MRDHDKIATALVSISGRPTIFPGYLCDSCSVIMNIRGSGETHYANDAHTHTHTQFRLRLQGNEGKYAVRSKSLQFRTFPSERNLSTLTVLFLLSLKQSLTFYPNERFMVHETFLTPSPTKCGVQTRLVMISCFGDAVQDFCCTEMYSMWVSYH